MIINVSKKTARALSALSAEEIADAIAAADLSHLRDYCPEAPVKIADLRMHRIAASRCAETIWGKSLPESHYRDLLHRKLGGRIEVSVPAGRIDVLTNTLCIEVKHWAGWKAAIGQALSYCCYVPQKPAVALIDLPVNVVVPAAVCHKLGVLLLDPLDFN